ncbi:MAG: hypothetical protein VYC34_10690 [Planctomycetota bacterium]|nr:hypothetical protein [Planctomycetota bacterium]
MMFNNRPQWLRRWRVLGAALLGAYGLSGPAHASGSSALAWDFELTTTGDTASWRSPAPLTGAASAYELRYEITRVEVKVRSGVFSSGPENATDRVPEETRFGKVEFEAGRVGVVHRDEVVFPEAPAPAALSGDVAVALDRRGHVQVQFTEPTLGRVSVETGFPFGKQRVRLKEVKIVGRILVAPLASEAPVDALETGIAAAMDDPRMLVSLADFDQDGRITGNDLRVFVRCAALLM